MRGHQDLVLAAFDAEVGQLVGRVQVADDGLGPLGQGRDQDGVLKVREKQLRLKLDQIRQSRKLLIHLISVYRNNFISSQVYVLIV